MGTFLAVIKSIYNFGFLLLHRTFEVVIMLMYPPARPKRRRSITGRKRTERTKRKTRKRR